MKRYSSSTIKLFDKHCPAALGFREGKTPEFRDMYQAGIAAHAVLQTVQEKDAKEFAAQSKVADAVVQELITNGRTYRGQYEPPMSPSDALSGRDIALSWLEFNGLPDNGIAEREYVINVGGLEFAALIDLVYEQDRGGEDYELPAVVARDYKTSWIAREDELDTLQRKGQAVVVWRHHPDVRVIVQEVVNLRLGATYEREILLDDEGTAMLQRWEQDIAQVCMATDATREARPGLNCIGCPYVLACEDAAKLLAPGVCSGLPADRWAFAKAVLAEIEPQLREQAKEGPVYDSFGVALGYQRKERRVVKSSAPAAVVDHWYPTGVPDNVSGLLMAANLGVSNIQSIAKALYPEKSRKNERLDFLDACLSTEPYAQFGPLSTVDDNQQ